MNSWRLVLFPVIGVLCWAAGGWQAAAQRAQVLSSLGAAANARPPEGWSTLQHRQAWATQRLRTSPRRSAWIELHAGARTLRGWAVYPETTRKAQVVLVLHEVFGLTDSTRNTADEIAAMGYIAITPDLLSGDGPAGGNSDSFEPPHSASETATHLRDETVNDDLNRWADYSKTLPGSNGHFSILGLSWGGGAAFRYISESPRQDMDALFIFYDVGPPAQTQKGLTTPGTVSVDKIMVPVYGFYPTRDTRVLRTLPATQTAMAMAGKRFDPVTFPDADHAYMRLGEDPADTNPANAAACRQSLERIRRLLASGP